MTNIKSYYIIQCEGFSTIYEMKILIRKKEAEANKNRRKFGFRKNKKGVNYKFESKMLKESTLNYLI